MRNLKLVLFTCVLLLAGCPNKITSLLQKKADYKTAVAKYSASVFLPRDAKNNNILLQIRNTTCPQFSALMQQQIVTVLKKQNFKIVADPLSAKFLLQANILQCNVNDKTVVQQALNDGYGAPIVTVPESNLSAKELSRSEQMVFSIIADLQISVQKRAIKPWQQYQTRLVVTKKPIGDRDFSQSVQWLIDEFAAAIMRIFSP